MAKLGEIENDLSENPLVAAGTIDLDEMDDVTDGDLLDEGEDNDWVKALREEGIFFSFPLDIDFAMLRAFPRAYQRSNPGGREPRGGSDIIRDKKAVTLKTGGNPTYTTTTMMMGLDGIRTCS